MFSVLTKTIVVGHCTVFHEFIPIFRMQQSSFSKKQNYIYKIKNKAISKATRHVQSKIQTYCLTRDFTCPVTSQLNSTLTV